MEIITDILPVVREVMAELQRSFRDELKAQGHNLTGKLSDSIIYDIEKDSDTVTAKMYIENYGLSVEFGVPANRIPYSGRTGSGGTSKYIQGLIRFWELRGLSGRNATSAAFATAAKHKKEGMPTRSSFGFSSTGERTGFIKRAIEAQTPKIQGAIEHKFGAILQLQFSENFKGYENIKLGK
jgi:hypothetical protein